MLRGRSLTRKVSTCQCTRAGIIKLALASKHDTWPANSCVLTLTLRLGQADECWNEMWPKSAGQWLGNCAELIRIIKGQMGRIDLHVPTLKWPKFWYLWSDQSATQKGLTNKRFANAIARGVSWVGKGAHLIYDRAKPRQTIYQNTLTFQQFYLLHLAYVLSVWVRFPIGMGIRVN